MIIGLLGKKRVGKDTAADHIVSASDGKFKKFSFATPMKEALKVVFDWSEDHVNGHLKEIVDPYWGISPRQALQDFGTQWAQHGLCERFSEFKRLTSRSIWVKRLLLEIENYPNIVISDVRFQHEVDALTQHGAIILKIVRPSITTVDEHESEKDIDKISCRHVIINDSTIEEYLEKVDRFWSILA